MYYLICSVYVLQQFLGSLFTLNDVLRASEVTLGKIV